MRVRGRYGNRENKNQERHTLRPVNRSNIHNGPPIHHFVQFGPQAVHHSCQVHSNNPFPLAVI